MTIRLIPDAGTGRRTENSGEKDPVSPPSLGPDTS